MTIGVSAYAAPGEALANAADDARTLAARLAADHGFIVTSDQTLYDHHASRDAIRDLLGQTLRRRLTHDDRLLVFFAGHGALMPGKDGFVEGHLLLADGAGADRWLSMGELRELLAALPCRHLLLVLDCCHAGAILWPAGRDLGGSLPAFPEIYESYVRHDARQVLVSAAGSQVASDGATTSDARDAASGRSPFLAAFLRGLAGEADRDGDGLVTVTDLYLYARRELGLHQTPGVIPFDRHDGGEFVFQVPGRPILLEPAPDLTPEANPYRDLASYTERDQAIFFGREGATSALLERVCAHRLVVVTGPSGSGKSSVVHAGLIPRLATRGWSIVPFTKGATPPQTTLRSMVSDLTIDSPETLIVIDQLEDLLASSSDDDAKAFRRELARAVLVRPQLRVLVTVREDVERHFPGEDLDEPWKQGRYLLEKMTPGELHDVITRPAATRGIVLEPHLTRRLFDEVALLPTPLPLLSFALGELYRTLRAGRPDRTLRRSDFEAFGSVARLIARRAEDAYEVLIDEDRGYAATTRNVMMRMVDDSGDARHVRRRVPLDDIDFGDVDENRRVEKVLDEFVAARLVTRGRDEGLAWAELAHDEVLRQWDRLSRWLDATREERELIRAVAKDEAVWRQSQRTTDLWRRNHRRSAAAELAKRPQSPINRRERAFIAASNRLHQRYVNIWGTGCVIVLGVIAFAVSAMIRESRAARRAEDEARLRAGELYLEQARRDVVDLEEPLSAIEDLFAARVNGVASPALRILAAQASRNLWLLDLPHGAAVTSVAFSPDGRRLVTAGSDGRAHIWDEDGGHQVLVGHTRQVWSAAMTPDGTRVVTASTDGTARIWDAATGTAVAPPLSHVKAVTDAVISPDGTRVVTTSLDRDARIWDARTGRRIYRLPHLGTVWTAGFDSSGTRIITASRADVAEIWDVATGAARGSLAHNAPVRWAAFGVDGEQAVTASEDGFVRVWNVATRRVLHRFAHDGIVVMARFSPDGERVVSASFDGTARIWTLSTGETRVLAHRGTVRSIAFSTDGQRIATGSDDGTARIWDARTGQPLSAPLAQTGPVWAVAFSADGRKLAVGDAVGARVWDATDTAPTLLLDHGAAVMASAVSADSARVVTAAYDGSAVLWDLAHGVARRIVHAGPVGAVAISADGQRLVTAGDDGLAWIWDSTTGRALDVPLVHDGAIRSIRFSPDQQLVVTASDDQSARVWRAATGQPVTPPLHHDGAVHAAAFSPDGTLVATASADHTVRLWHVASGAERWRRRGERGVHAARFTSDGRGVLSVDLGPVVPIFDVATGVPIALLTHERNASITAAEISPDGARIVTASSEGTAFIWNAMGRIQVERRLQHGRWIRTVAFDRAGALLVTAGDDGASRMWSVDTGTAIAPPLRHDGAVTSVSIAADGARLLTTSTDGTARVWRIGGDTGGPSLWFALTAARMRAWPQFADRSNALGAPLRRATERRTVESIAPPHWLEPVAPPRERRSGASARLGVCKRRDSRTVASLEGVAWSADHRVAVAVGAGGTIVRSTDGVAWEVVASVGPDAQFRAVIYGGGRFVAVGSDRPTRHDRLVATSTDGLLWDVEPAPQESTLTDVAYGNGVYVGVGLEGAIAYSTDARNWTVHLAVTNEGLEAVSFVRGRFFAHGQGGLVLVSSDGEHWTQSALAPPARYARIIDGEDAYVLPGGGDVATVLRSDDLATWTPHVEPDVGFLGRSAFARGTYWAIGESPRGLWASRDAAAWHRIVPSPIFEGGDVVWTGDRVIAVGAAGAIFTCVPPHLPPQTASP